MKHRGFVIVAAVSFVAGWLTFLLLPKSKPPDVTIALTRDASGDIKKDLNPPQALIYCNHDVIWAISNGTRSAPTVDLRDFLDKETKKRKNPIEWKAKAVTIQPGETCSIKGKVKQEDLFDADPPGKSDAFGRYQDFIYAVAVDDKSIDPEVRIRK